VNASIPLAKWKKVALILCFFVIAFSSGYYLLTDLDWSIITNVNITLLLVLIIVTLIYIIIAAFSSWVLLRNMGYRISLPTLTLVHTVSLSSSYTTPVKAGIPVRLWLYEVFFSIPLIPSSVSIMVEMTLGVFISFAFSLIGAILLLTHMETVVLLALLVSVLVLFVGVKYLKPEKLKLSGNGFISRQINRVLRWWRDALDSIRCVSKGTLFAVAILYAIRLYMRAVCLKYVLLAVGADSSVFQILLIESMSGLIGLVSMLPMGLGAKDASLVGLLVRVGVSPELALAAALVDRTLWTLVPIVVGFIAANILGMKGLMQERKNQVDG
jgi:uncharacterized protein (TIRG00374 family)